MPSENSFIVPSGYYEPSVNLEYERMYEDACDRFDKDKEDMIEFLRTSCDLNTNRMTSDEIIDAYVRFIISYN